jgi:4-hydroxy-tetrahydrodipicolinate reductase
MNILLVGYGQMGQAVETIAHERGHTIAGRVRRQNFSDLGRYSAQNVDAVIEFTHPSTAPEVFQELIPKQVPIVTGTSGWYDQLETYRQLVQAHSSSFLYAPNFSIGVNIMLKVNELLAGYMEEQAQYDVFLEERHHRYKHDAPSGTAHRLAETLLAQLSRKSRMADPDALKQRPPEADELSVSATRAGEIPGLHRVVYSSAIDKIELQHEAYSRKGFALGAVKAAEWLAGRQGFFSIQAMLFGEGA